jgi:hypothetical protein
MRDWPDEQYELFEEEERRVDRFIIGGMIFCAVVIIGLIFYVW